MQSLNSGLAAVLCLVLASGLSACGNSSSPPESSPTADTSATRATASTSVQPASDTVSFPRKAPDSLSIPEGMVYVPGGRTRIGVNPDSLQTWKAQRSPGMRPMFGDASTPPFDTTLTPFFLDKHPVTVAQFREFVEDTGFTTQAERFGNAGVLKNGQWRLVDGATWRYPQGPDASAAPDDHPVTQVSWNDAQAYCEWAGKRLPTEVEWEHAARDARNDRSVCPWDGSCRERSARLENANTWQGQFPVRNTAADGYQYTSPVGAFGETPLGLQDMSGNVWEWTASAYRPYTDGGNASSNPKERVQRGGSFLCNECGGYRVFSRSHSTPETSLFHVGFRCAKDVPSG